MSDNFKVVGKPLAKVDALPQTTGEAKYAADFMPGNGLFGRVLRSPLPHGKILNIDTRRAERLTGVKGVITGRDTLGVTRYGDEMPIAVERVRYVGEGVAAVAATSEDIAEEALDLIEVEYEPLPAVFDPEQALLPDAPQIHEEWPGNVGLHFKWDFGDVDKAFAASHHIRDDRFSCEGVSHGMLEPHTILAQYDSSSDRLTVWAAAQAPYVLRSNLAMSMGLPETHVRVIKPHLGGGFGGKGEIFAHDLSAALLSKKTGLPVLFVITREEVFGATRQRHPMIHYLKTGVDKQGRITARYCKIIADGGAYLSMGKVALHNAGQFLILPYHLPNYRYDGFRAYTNNSVSGALRGFGGPQSFFAQESQLDMIAADLGMDPAEIRLRNAVKKGYVTCNQQRVTTCAFSESIEKAVQMTGWKTKRADAGQGRGIGIGCNAFYSGAAFVPRKLPTVDLEIQADGAIILRTGASDLGQGSNTIIAQVAAEALGVHLEDITVALLDTDVCPFDIGSFSSRVSMFVGNAARLAGAEAKRIILEALAEKFEVSPAELSISDRRVEITGCPERGMSFKEAIQTGFASDRFPIAARGAWNSGCIHPNWETGIGQVTPAYSFGSQIAEVEVDQGTGQVRVLSFTAVHDCGTPINPLAIEGQVHGSIAGGMGQALTERLVRDRGSMLTSSFLTYSMPTSLDMPMEINSETLGEPDPAGPFGAKESGESLQCSTAPAIANAIYHAVGVRITDLPITPEKILAALEKKNAQAREK
ncbi:MAG: molybdopterin-dependent oxidoreductase [Desulfobacterales bacterium]|nr:molybdopterin-dependent oxidoreductase [Desulfobacterales bacterium]